MQHGNPLPWSHRDQRYELEDAQWQWERFALLSGHDFADVAEQLSCVDTGDDAHDLICAFDRDRLLDEARD